MIFYGVFKLFLKNNNTTTDIDYNTYYEYVTDNSKLNEENKVKDYNTFLEIQDACDNYISYLMDKKYSSTYSILDDNMKNKYNRKDYIEKISKYTTTNFPDDNGGEYSYKNNNNLNSAYKISDNNYICNINSINGNTYIGVKMNDNNTYVITYVSL